MSEALFISAADCVIMSARNVTETDADSNVGIKQFGQRCRKCLYECSLLELRSCFNCKQ
jgi:hypothetical protein